MLKTFLHQVHILFLKVEKWIIHTGSIRKGLQVKLSGKLYWIQSNFVQLCILHYGNFWFFKLLTKTLVACYTGTKPCHVMRSAHISGTINRILGQKDLHFTRFQSDCHPPPYQRYKKLIDRHQTKCKMRKALLHVQCSFLDGNVEN